MANIKDRSSEILEIRAAARRTTVEAMLREHTCPTCCRGRHSPYREYDSRGKVRAGCVDAHHTGALVGESASWHSRSEAREIRKTEWSRISR